ncbi:hypothetical protein Kpol_325p10 [Vanderwaltozyma polyspora DSM 70294]|uniref:Thioredoxin domain-containing protein n=1 Tax=Vanderwaltozyma polyspora (strain ATCC 22028 / DSM 70294 / BCRC 21397 / CBS 2163 / NBRC 10782 / NRRL Y-8283 / UCD 57-17) TaxID=436907 RepID=A7TSU3_VANPO|nr:uncharacterized protein Kpol_325p10 [Vanderwaltozyma polyspora DSM 70294]EDO14671.1 hypothetical protein Kpol_325p10 [Vanderwaltozyma polyspora DSM 70294]
MMIYNIIVVLMFESTYGGWESSNHQGNYIVFECIIEDMLLLSSVRSGSKLLLLNNFYRFKSSYESIVKINELNEFKQKLIDNKNGLSVIDFYATWCGPCRAMAPHLSKFVKEYPNVSFYKIDVDENPDIAQHCEVTAMPTFVLAKNGEIIDKLVGADPVGLEKTINENK